MTSVRALVRAVPDSFVRALAEHPRRISIPKARRQHARYVAALEAAGAAVLQLDADEAYPDCPFVEDQAVVVGHRAVITRAGHPSRRGEAAAVRATLEELGIHCQMMEAPAQLDGGDVLQVADTLYVGRSGRTNGEGMAMLARMFDRAVVPVPVGGLHLKSVCSSPGDRLVLVAEHTVDPALFSGCDVLVVPEAEAQAANVVGCRSHRADARGLPDHPAGARGTTSERAGVGPKRVQQGRWRVDLLVDSGVVT